MTSSEFQQLLTSLDEITIALVGDPLETDGYTILERLISINESIGASDAPSISSMLQHIVTAIRDVSIGIGELTEAVNTFSIPDPTSAMMAAAAGIQSELARIGDLLTGRPLHVPGTIEHPVTAEETQHLGRVLVGVDESDDRDHGLPVPFGPAVVLKVRQVGPRFYRADDGRCLFVAGSPGGNVPDAGAARRKFIDQMARNAFGHNPIEFVE